MAHSCPNKTKEPEKPHFPPCWLINGAEDPGAGKQMERCVDLGEGWELPEAGSIRRRPRWLLESAPETVMCGFLLISVAALVF